MKDGNGERTEELLGEHRLEIKNRIKSLFWTVSGDYTLEFEPDVEDYARSKHIALKQPAIYDGEEAVKDTASEVRRARNQGISVIGIFVGNETDLPAEKRIFGKDFAYIRNISNFSRITGTFLRRQIDTDLAEGG